MALAIYSTGGYLSRNGGLAFAGDMTYLGASLCLGSCPNFAGSGHLGDAPMAMTIWNDGTGHTTFDIQQEAPDNPDAVGANALWLFGRNAADVDQFPVIFNNGGYFGRWIHWAITVNGGTRNCNLYFLYEGFNAANPAYLIAKNTFGTLLNNTNALGLWAETDFIPDTIAKTWAHGRYIASQFEATEAQVLTQMASRAIIAPFAANTYTLLPMVDPVNPHLDFGSSRANFTKTTTNGDFAEFARQPMEWSVGGFFAGSF